ncbi:hypothetical protein CISIN_1g033005mg [Citrus sinensis]|uniref:Uncharacterized protein n=1 Tax=Citrus sinensis TaxID=2711 RepID=A0A067F4A1_CITSI|nr:hypothetical protein CISIN_1g033005mg [Citrus sinensis]
MQSFFITSQSGHRHDLRFINSRYRTCGHMLVSKRKAVNYVAPLLTDTSKTNKRCCGQSQKDFINHIKGKHLLNVSSFESRGGGRPRRWRWTRRRKTILSKVQLGDIELSFNFYESVWAFIIIKTFANQN